MRHTEASRPEGTADGQDVGERYRFERLALPMVLRDLRFEKGDPGPGDRACLRSTFPPWAAVAFDPARSLIPARHC
jgi:hypothetical protein